MIFDQDGKIYAAGDCAKSFLWWSNVDMGQFEYDIVKPISPDRNCFTNISTVTVPAP